MPRSRVTTRLQAATHCEEELGGEIVQDSREPKGRQLAGSWQVTAVGEE